MWESSSSPRSIMIPSPGSHAASPRHSAGGSSRSPERRLAVPSIEIHQAVVRDRVDPGGEFRAGLIAPAGIDDAHPEVLEQFFGCGRIADLSQQEPGQGETMAAVEQLEGA